MSQDTNLLEFSDNSYRPQDDLFRFVNGVWLKDHQIPEDQTNDGAFYKLRLEAEDEIKRILESDEYRSKLPLAKAFYDSYMDTDSVYSYPLDELHSQIAKVDAVKTISELSELIYANWTERFAPPFSLYVSSDADNPDVEILHLNQGGLSLPDEEYYREERHHEFVQNWKDFATKLQVLNGVTEQEAKTAAQEILKMETEIAKGHMSKVNMRDPQKIHNTYTLESADKIGPLSLLEMFSTPEGDDFKAASKNITPDSKLNVNQPAFFEHLKKFWTDEYLEVWKNKLKLKLLQTWAGVRHETDDAAFEYQQKVSGIAKRPERWREAVRSLGVVGDEIGKVYVDLNFGAEARLRMNLMIANLIEAYHQSIKCADWMTEKTREKALLKLSQFTPNVGLPKEWHDYSLLKLTDDFMKNAFAISRFYTCEALSRVNQKVNKNLWFMTPQTVNAYYDPSSNQIVFPAAILQAPFFSDKASDAENYGGIGAVIGHEIGHGFDDQGSQYDGLGKLENWWTSADRAKFEEKTKLLQSQYSKFLPLQLVEEMGEEAQQFHVNGELTTGENVGDISGLKIALLALALSKGYSSVEELVENCPDDVKNFFYSFARIWQGKCRLETAKQLIALDPHSPAEFRANCVRNLDAFQKVFDVQPGDALFLEKTERVDIW